MKNGRINERNCGNHKLDGGAKQRRKSSSKIINKEERFLAKEVLIKVLHAMEYDKAFSNKGHLHPEAMFTDGGRITMSMTRKQFELLSDLIDKL